MNFNEAVIADFREHRGEITTGMFKGRKLLLLTTTGARSGTEHTNPLAYSRDGERYVVVASKGGAPTNPGWYHNLRAHPTVTVEAGPERFRARAIVAEPEAERKRLFEQHAELMPGFRDYERKTTRRIPVVMLERI